MAKRGRGRRRWSGLGWRSPAETPGELEEGVHVGEVAGEADRHPYGPGALAVDAAAEVVVLHVTTGVLEAGDDLVPREAEGQLAGARVAEAARTERDLPARRFALDACVVDDVAARVVEVHSEGAAALAYRPRTVEPHRGLAVPVPHGQQPVDHPAGEAAHALVNDVPAGRLEHVEAELDGGNHVVVQRAVLEGGGAEGQMMLV